MSTESAIAPTDLRDFLRAHNWKLVGRALADRLYILEHDSFPQRQLVFPMDLTAPDYAESVDLVLSKLSKLSGQLKASLVSQIAALKDDVLRLRISFDGDDRALPLNFASALVDSTEKLLRSAACTVLLPRIHHPRLSLSEAAQFVEMARFGQTESGSFILRISCPINSMEVQGNLKLTDYDTPFVRQVTLSLQQALSQLTAAIEADTLVKLIDELKQSPTPLVSSNLCEAISSMHDDRIDNCLDVDFGWSVLRKVVDPLFLRPVRIQRDYFSRIEEVRRELRAVELHEEDTFIGTVERLDGEMSADGRRSGSVVLSLLLPDEGESVKARIILLANDYAKADYAHITNGAYVRVTGRLRPGRQPRQITDMTSFEILAT